jgi:hypothetical protein
MVAPGLSGAVSRTVSSGDGSGAAYVALGDSYASGEGLAPYESGTDLSSGQHKNLCHRSLNDAYGSISSDPVVLPAVTSRAFWACSGTTTGDMSRVTGQYGQPEQISTVGASTKYMSVSVGGDDIGFASLAAACTDAVIAQSTILHLPGTSCAMQVSRSESLLGALKARLTALYATLLTRSRHALLLVVNYPRIFPGSYPSTPTVDGQPFCILDDVTVPASLASSLPASLQRQLTVPVGVPGSDATLLDGFERSLNTTIAAAVSQVGTKYRSRILLVDAYDASVAASCTGTTSGASVNGLVLSPDATIAAGTSMSWTERLKAFVSPASFHPTLSGQQMFARVIQDAIVGSRSSRR